MMTMSGQERVEKATVTALLAICDLADPMRQAVWPSLEFRLRKLEKSETIVRSSLPKLQCLVIAANAT